MRPGPLRCRSAHHRRRFETSTGRFETSTGRFRTSGKDDSKRARSASRSPRRKVGFPKSKKKGVKDSCRFSTGAIKALGSHVQLPRLGKIRVKETTEVKGRILSATISREADRWFVSFAVERERDEPKAPAGGAAGVDLGIESFAVVSDGEVLQSPRPLERGLKRLRRLQKKHARKQKGSSNRRKSAVRLGRHHRRIRNQRRDFLHKVTTKLAKTKRAIVVEDLRVRNMSVSARGTQDSPGKNVRAKSGLNRSILDQGWGEFRRMLEYKTVWYGSELVVAPAFYPSSKTCSGCGFVKKGAPAIDTRVGLSRMRDSARPC